MAMMIKMNNILVHYVGVCDADQRDGLSFLVLADNITVEMGTTSVVRAVAVDLAGPGALGEISFRAASQGPG